MLNKYMWWSLALALVCWACEDDREIVTIAPGSAPAIEAPTGGSTYDITEDNLTEDLATFSWSKADFGFSAAVTYGLEMAPSGTDFAEPISVASALTTTSVTINNESLNQLLISNGLDLETDYAVDFRVSATVNPNVDALVSAPVTLTINPQPVAIDYPLLTMPGSYQGWNEKDSTTVIWSASQDDTYDGYVYFANPGEQFKFSRSSWDADKNWGDNGADGTLEADGDNITQTEAGLHRLTADLNGLTYSSTKTDWGMVGDGTPGGWDNDTPLAYDPVTRLLTVTLDLTAPGKIKFRANGLWDINLGDSEPAIPGLDYGGTDIDVPESGNYTVTLDLTQAVYTYELVKN